MTSEFSLLDEHVFLRLSSVELVRQQVLAEIVQGVAESGCSSSIDGEHVPPFKMALR